MIFRYARHTNNLNELVRFYTDIVGLSNLGGFENHSNYNGVFLGKEGADWHIEFTESDYEATHQPDEDDLLVFYLDSNEELNRIKEKIKVNNILIHSSKNPYWRANGIEIKDPDGFGIIFTIRN